MTQMPSSRFQLLVIAPWRRFDELVLGMVRTIGLSLSRRETFLLRPVRTRLAADIARIEVSSATCSC